jgi:hypothetical protein
MERFEREDYLSYVGDAPYVNEIRERIRFEGPLSDEQKDRLLKIAADFKVARRFLAACKTASKYCENRLPM